MQDAHGFLEELCTNLEKDNQHLTDKLKKLESAQKNLENSNDQLLQAREKIAEEKTEMEKEMARLKGLEATDNEQHCIIFAHDFKQIDRNYNLDKLKELLNNHFKQRLAFKCNNENLSALKSE